MKRSSLRFAASVGLVLGLAVAGGCGKESTIATGSGGTTEPGTVPSGSSGASPTGSSGASGSTTSSTTTSSSTSSTTAPDATTTMLPPSTVDPTTAAPTTAAAVTTAAAGSSGSEDAGTQPPVDPAPVTSISVTDSTEPEIDVAGYDNAGDIVKNPGAKNPRPTALATMEPAGNSIRVTWWGGVCDQLASATANETADKIVLDVRVGTDPTKDMCTEQAVMTRTVITLKAPVGTRVITDANA